MTDTITSGPATTAPTRRGLTERLGNELRFVPVAVGLLALFLFFSLQSDVFLTSRNLNNLLM